MDCQKCKWCNLIKFHSGQWYCNNPKTSIFDVLMHKQKNCFENQKKGKEVNEDF